MGPASTKLHVQKPKNQGTAEHQNEVFTIFRIILRSRCILLGEVLIVTLPACLEEGLDQEVVLP